MGAIFVKVYLTQLFAVIEIKKESTENTNVNFLSSEKDFS